jgi:outer membrane lipoprotein carrier protein
MPTSAFIDNIRGMRSFICLMLLLAVAPLIRAQDVEMTIRRLEHRYHRAGTLEAAFFESYTDGNGGISAESGTVYFSRPGRMRWEYEVPEEKLFLVDGRNVWFYVPADHTASRAKLNESSDWRTPLALLAGKADISKLCRKIEAVDDASNPHSAVGEQTSRAAGGRLLRCIPRDGSGDDATGEILFETDPQAYLVRVVIREPGNIKTEFRFGNWQENIPIPEIKFHFEPPPGVSIVDEETLAGAMH